MVLRREVKNIVKNFSNIEVKVREATSNDPWGTPTSLLSEIADSTNNERELTEIMQLLWKRLNENGKNWRHVYKSLVVLEYILKTGNERIANQCKDNMFVLKALGSFEFVDKEGKDHGSNVRERSKQLVALLEDDRKLKDECERAVKAKMVVHKTGGSGNKTGGNGNKSTTSSEKKYRLGKKNSKRNDNFDNPNAPASADRTDIDELSPSTKLEEDLQLQIALAESNEEAEKCNKDGSTAIDATIASVNTPPLNSNDAPPTQVSLLDLDDAPIATKDSIDAPFSNTADEFPSFFPTQLTEDPWAAPTASPPSHQDTNMNTTNLLDDFFAPSFPACDEFISVTAHAHTGSPPLNFLEVGAHLVDLENIVSADDTDGAAGDNIDHNNPFKPSNPASCPSKNPFFQEKPKPKSINELRVSDMNAFASQTFASDLRVSHAMTQCDTPHNPFRALMVAT